MTTLNLKRHFLIKPLLLLTLLICSKQKTLAQSDTKTKDIQSIFYVYYDVSPNSLTQVWNSPTFQLKGKNFIYTDNSYVGKKKEIDTICLGTFRQSSIDSIIQIVKDLKDTTIFKINDCRISGGVHNLTVATGVDTTKFEMVNTFDYTALKITDIINEYLPLSERLRVSEKLIKEEEDCSNKTSQRETRPSKK
jgi:hypothetical protein